MAKKSKPQKIYSEKAKVVIELLKNINKNDLCWMLQEEPTNRVLVNLIQQTGPIVTKKSVGGISEDDGSKVVRIFHFPDHDVYLKLRGYYSSQDGMDFYGSEYEEVFPQKKVVTVYVSALPTITLTLTLTEDETSLSEVTPEDNEL